jgi:hypothetical protein
MAQGYFERPHLLAQDLRVEERFGFDSHLPVDRLCGAGKKPSRFLKRVKPSRFTEVRKSIKGEDTHPKQLRVER